MPSRSLWRHCNMVGLYLVAWPLIGCLSSVSWQRFTKRRYCFHPPDLTILWMIMMFSEGHSSVVTYAMPNKKRMLISGCHICAWQLLSIDVNDSVWTPKLSLSLTLPTSSRKRLIMLSHDSCQHKEINTLRPRQNGRHFADDIFKCIFFNENVWFPIKISLNFVPKGLINNIISLVQKMAWRQAIIWINDC